MGVSIGYGGNGTVYSMMGAKMLAALRQKELTLWHSKDEWGNKKSGVSRDVAFLRSHKILRNVRGVFGIKRRRDANMRKIGL